MSVHKKIKQIVSATPTTDGAGVQLKRLLSLPQVKAFDPFLMLDLFQSKDSSPGPGFPWHPHRGIITITYMLTGSIEHEDSLGNHGIVSAGGVQWMKAASGIVHQEMPLPSDEGIKGFQFWLNLAAADKMSTPEYGDIQQIDIPTVSFEGVTVRVIAGDLDGVTGPLYFPGTEPELYDYTIAPSQRVICPVAEDKNYFLIGVHGSLSLGDENIPNEEAILLDSGDTISLTASKQGARVLLVGGRKLEEPIAWRGPIVMNSEKELNQAFYEYQQGTFIKVD